MADAPSGCARWDKKHKVAAKAQRMREAKHLKKLLEQQSNQVSDDGEATQSQQPQGNTPEEPPRVVVPEASPPNPVNEQRDLEEDPDGEEEEELYTDPQEVFDDFILTLTREQRKMLSVLLYESFQNRKKMSKMDSSRESTSITGLQHINST